MPEGFGAGGFQLRGGGVRRVAAAMRDNADLTAAAGTALAGLGEVLPAPPIGDRLQGALAGFATAWCDVLGDMVLAMTGLSGWMDDAVTSYFSEDDDVAYRYGGLHP